MFGPYLSPAYTCSFLSLFSTCPSVLFWSIPGAATLALHLEFALHTFLSSSSHMSLAFSNADICTFFFSSFNLLFTFVYTIPP